MWLVGFYLCIRLVGFTLALPLFVLAYAKTYGARWYGWAILAAASRAFIYGAFEQILHVPWPEAIRTGFDFSQADV